MGRRTGSCVRNGSRGLRPGWWLVRGVGILFGRGPSGIWIIRMTGVVILARATKDATSRRRTAGKDDVPACGRTEAAVERALLEWPDLAGSVEAATARAMAVELDNPNSATSKSMCARAMLDAIDRLRALAPAVEEDDALDGLQADYSTRLRSVG